MADKNELKARLKRKIDLGIPKYVKAERLDEAADKLIRAGRVDKPLLEIIGRDASEDKSVQVNFSNTDIDDINDILNQLKGS